MKSRKLTDRFLEFVDISQPKEKCWLWNGTIRGGKYGAIMINWVAWPTHRLSWVVHYGKVPKGMLVCHTCDNPPCVNPNHLFLGTTRDNAIDRAKKNRGYKPKGELHHHAKLREKDVLRIRELKVKKVKNRIIAERFGIEPRQVRRIASRFSWSHI